MKDQFLSSGRRGVLQSFLLLSKTSCSVRESMTELQLLPTSRLVRGLRTRRVPTHGSNSYSEWPSGTWAKDGIAVGVLVAFIFLQGVLWVGLGRAFLRYNLCIAWFVIDGFVNVRGVCSC